MMVMYGGSVIESGPTASVFGHMAHPYTRGLFGARPRLGARAGQRLVTIEGTVPELVDLPAGCAFADRCAWAQPPCVATRPPATDLGAGHAASCLRLDAVMAQDPA
jgi:peptide/nickel transport system ATP-binding protein